MIETYLTQEKQSFTEPEITAAQWDFILKLKTGSKKIAKVLEAIASGELSREDVEQEVYLGRRHWELIHNKSGKKTRALRGMFNRNFNEEEYDLALEVSALSQKKAEEVLTLDDYYAGLKHYFSYDTDVFDVELGRNVWAHVVWSEHDGEWEEQRTEAVGMKYGIYQQNTLVKAADPNLILEKWLLDSSEIEDPIHTPPEVLTLFARTEVPEEVLMERSGFPFGWEKVI